MFFWGLKKRKAMGPPKKKHVFKFETQSCGSATLKTPKIREGITKGILISWHILAIYKDLKHPHEPNRHLLKMGNCFPQVRLVFHAQDTERCAASDGASVAGDID